MARHGDDDGRRETTRAPRPANPARARPRAWTAIVQRFRPLTEDYWPADATAPYLRLAIAVLAAPLVLTLAAGAASGLLYFNTMPDRSGAWGATAEALVSFLSLFFAMSAVSAVTAAPALWSLRERRFWAWAAAGGGVGFSFAMVLWAGEGALGAVTLAVLVTLGALLALMIRAVAGVRGRRRRRR